MDKNYKREYYNKYISVMQKLLEFEPERIKIRNKYIFVFGVFFVVLFIYIGQLVNYCSDFENPPEHDLPCMLMYSCRDSGYGIDVEEDGSWKFYPFDENGNTLAWSYLNKTTRLYGLWVDVKGKIENGIIHVSLLKEG